MNTVNLNEKAFNIELCIFCQKDNNLISTENGRRTIQEASIIRDDRITRILSTIGESIFSYHVSNDCYKTYTNKTLLKRIQKNKTKTNENPTPTDESTTADIRKSERGIKQPPPNPDPDEVLYHVNCIICDKKSHKKIYKKCRISESSRAKAFLKATVYFQDKVFIRTCDLQDEHSVFGADLYYHQVCLQNFIQNHKNLTKDQPETTQNVNEKVTLWKQVLDDIKNGMLDGKGYELSSIRDYLNSKLSQEDSPFLNRDIKVLLTNSFGSSIDFAYSDSSRKSLMVFNTDNDCVNDFAERIRSVQPIKVVASIIREELSVYDFDLDGKFCDAADLDLSFANVSIPATLLEFFSVLFNFEIDTYKRPLENDLDDLSCDDDKKKKSNKLTNAKRLKLDALFQSMFYIFHSGRKKTPMHIVNAVWASSLGNGGSTFTKMLNHVGLSMSYTELLRYQHDLAVFSAKTNNGRIHIPSHFKKDLFTSGALDNWDHEGENASIHDTVAVLYQDNSTVRSFKPKLKEANIAHGPRGIVEMLECQKLLEFFKPTTKPNFPKTISIDPNIFYYSETTKIHKKDLSWQLSRLHLPSIFNGEMINPEKQAICSWKAFNLIITEENIPVKTTAFLPVLPHPCTEYSAVYTVLKNFVDLCDQLKQDKIPVYCDKKVYCMVKEIQFWMQVELNCIIPCLGSFHTIKTLLKCIGKSLRGSGVETLLLDAAEYGPSIIEKSILGGSHYNRSLEAFSSLSESFNRLLLKEFFKSCDIDLLFLNTDSLSQLQTNISKDPIKCKSNLDDFITNNSEFFLKFKEFKNALKEKNKNAQYWIQFLDRMQIVYDLIRADREGNWSLHLDAIQRSLFEFSAWDRTNYIRWGSVYLEEMRSLKINAPYIYEQFIKGSFSIKTSNNMFTAVGGDQKLEQTINLASKKSNSIIYNSKDRNIVAKWDLIYHEILQVKQLYTEYLNLSDTSFECFQHHELSQPFTDKFETRLPKVIRFIEENGSPFLDTTTKLLHNFVTKTIIPDSIQNGLLNATQFGKEKYIDFRNKCFYTKSESLFSTIHRNNLKTMENVSERTPVKSAKQVAKQITLNDKKIEIARERGLSTDEILGFDLVPSPLLYSDKCMTKPNKSKLITELEICLKEGDYSFEIEKINNVVTIIDVMANMRKLPWKHFLTFGDMLRCFLNGLSCFIRKGQCHFIIDIYDNKPSVKDSERLRRHESNPIDMTEIKETTPVPKDLSSFWPSNSNKDLLERFLYLKLTELKSNHGIVLGQLDPEDEKWQCKIKRDVQLEPYMHSQPYLDEADLRVVIHANHSSSSGFSTIVVLSSDTDVIIALLYHISRFSNNGLKELWVKGGKGNTTRCIPIHTLFQRLGKDLCSVLPALHSLTGCDITSKIGTKKAALNASPCTHLTSFGSFPFTCKDITAAERFLVNVLNKNSAQNNHNELRVYLFNTSAEKSHGNLPPTSIGLLPHIKRAFYNTYNMTNVLMENFKQIDPTLYGFILEDTLLLPERKANEISD